MAKSNRQLLADYTAQIAALQVKVEEVKVKIAGEVNTDDAQPGRTITFVTGKGENKKTVTGEVIGRKNAAPGDKGPGDLLKVAVGEGFEAQLITVYPSSITAIAPLASVDAPVADAPVNADE